MKAQDVYGVRVYIQFVTSLGYFCIRKTSIMKKLLLTLIVIGSCFGARGQTNVYHPFPTVYGDWGGIETIYPYPGSGGSTQMYKYIYYTSGDTTISALTYKKVNYINQGMFFGVPTPLNQIFTGGAYNFAYRNDSLNKKVYIIPQDSLNEKIWYDFNLHIGDTLKNTYSTGGSNFYTFK